MDNPAELALVQKAVASGLGGCVDWDPDVEERVEMDLSRHGGVTLPLVRQLLIEYVRKGGTITQVKENRESWKAKRDFWYKAIVPMPAVFSKGLFVELVLVDEDAELPEVRLVNAHEQL